MLDVPVEGYFFRFNSLGEKSLKSVQPERIFKWKFGPKLATCRNAYGNLLFRGSVLAKEDARRSKAFFLFHRCFSL